MLRLREIVVITKTQKHKKFYDSKNKIKIKKIDNPNCLWYNMPYRTKVDLDGFGGNFFAGYCGVQCQEHI